jgi:hypothetical protein
MFESYLSGDKLYLKDKIRIECAEYFEYDGKWSSNHEWIELEDYIDVFFVEEHKMIFNNGRHFIYWCDMSIFLKHNCITISEIRDLKIEGILD